MSATQYFAKNSMVPLPYSPYSLDVVLYDIVLFTPTKRGMKEYWFDNIGEVKLEMKKELPAIFDDKYKKYFKQWNQSKAKKYYLKEIRQFNIKIINR